MANSSSYKGTDLKFRFRADGAFSFNDHEWDIAFTVGAKSCKMTKRNQPGGAFIVTCDKQNMGVKACSDGSWIFLLDTTYFGHGRLVAVLTEYIPDADFDPTETFPTLDSVRNEVARFSMHNILDI